MINRAYEIGDEIRFEVTPKDFGRIAAQTAKQVIMQRVREAERSIVYDEYSQYENEIMQGVVDVVIISYLRQPGQNRSGIGQARSNA